MRNQPSRDYQSNDVVMTPAALAGAVVRVLQPSGRILEPCKGTGSFYEALRPFARDLDWCEISEGRDFLTHNGGLGYDWIVTNPPWSKFRPFLTHSLFLAENVVFLATVNHWWTKRRVQEVTERGFGYRRLILLPWPAEFPSSGFQLGAMHVQRGYRGPLEVIDLRTGD